MTFARMMAFLPFTTAPHHHPKGLWKAQIKRRVKSLRHPAGIAALHANNEPNVDDDQDEYFLHSEAEHEYDYDYAPIPDELESVSASPTPPATTPPAKRESCWGRTRIMNTASTVPASASSSSSAGSIEHTCGMEDWEDLKDLFNIAAENYDHLEPAEAIPFIRAVIHESHRLLIATEDPSSIYADTNELPTAFHAILGTALFLFANLIAQNSELAIEDEPRTPIPYWLTALDVFETGENLPMRTSGLSERDIPEDWRMAIVWGRTLVCIADEILTRAKADPAGEPSAFVDQDLDWPQTSPFHAISQRTPQITRRLSLGGVSAHDMMVIAMDHFSRGIFHMPHNSPPSDPSFSRPKELYTLASEVLLLSEKFTAPSERQQWAQWADSVFNQMKMEADFDTWREPINSSRGRCWLIFGSAGIEEIEDALEKASTQAEVDTVLHSEEAEEAREGLTKAIEFFEKALGSATSTLSSTSESELRKMLTEAIVELANLTGSDEQREELYRKAVRESKGTVELDDLLGGGKMDVDES